MDPTPPTVQDLYGELLDDETLAPLKRNQACLQCKRRKVKCDALKPTCSPCLRSHAHALRSSQRNSTTPPSLLCTYAEGDEDHLSSPGGEAEASSRRPSAVERKKVVKRPGASVKNKVLGVDREKDKRAEEDKETLLARISDLESRLSQINASASGSGDSRDSIFTPAESLPPTMADFGLHGFGQAVSDSNAGMHDFSATISPIEEIKPTSWNAAPQQASGGPDWDFGGLFMIPAQWPPNLPAPFLLEHLVDTFFNCVPQLPRILHRATLMTRIKLPPSNPNFPHAALLHAICSVASMQTAWVNSLPPEVLQDKVMNHLALGLGLESIEDFGLAQAESARRAMDSSMQSCVMGGGQILFELAQATLILSTVYFTKGMPLQAWLMAGVPTRLIKSLELGNRNRPRRHKEAILQPPLNPVEREERLATVWMAHIFDSGLAINSYFGQSMYLDEVLCSLPTSAEEFKRKNTDEMLENPQTAHSTNVLTDHPVADTFVLVAKSSILLSRAAAFLRAWHQREMKPGDEAEGQYWPTYLQLTQDIFAFH